MPEVYQVGDRTAGYRWDGSRWVPVEGVAVDGYRWDGSQWVPVEGVAVDGYRWDGSQWAPVEGATVDGYRWEGSQWVPVGGFPIGAPSGVGAPFQELSRPVDIGMPSEPKSVRPLVRRPGFWVLIVLGVVLSIWVAANRQLPASTPQPTQPTPIAQDTSLATPIVQWVAAGKGPAAIAVDPASGTVFVADMTSVDDSFSISLVKDEQREADGIPLGYSQPIGLAFDATTSTLYVAHMGENQAVMVMDATTHFVRADILGGQQCEALAFDPDHGVLYCAAGQSVVAVDASSAKVLKKLKVGKHPTALALDTSLNRLYVGYTDPADYSEWIAVVDTESGKVVSTFDVDLQPFGLAVDGSHRLYVGDANGGGIDVIDPETRTVTKHIRVDAAIMGLAIDPARAQLWASDYGSDAVAVISLD